MKLPTVDMTVACGCFVLVSQFMDAVWLCVELLMVAVVCVSVNVWDV